MTPARARTGPRSPRAADRRLAVGVAAARLPRRGAARPAADLIRAASRAAARPRSGEPLRDVRRPPGGDAAGRAAGRLRRDLRHPPALQPVPDLLRPRRHPQARDGAAAVQADLPARPASSSTTTRAARPPLRRAGVRRHRRPGRCGRQLLLDHRAGLELLRLSLRDAGSPWAGAVEAVTRDAAAAARRRARRRPPAGRRGAARGGGRADAVRRRPPSTRPDRRRRRSRCRCRPFPRSPLMDDVPVGGRPLHLPDDLRRRPLLALPLRQVRLDHALLAALREPAAADRAARCSTSACSASSAATSSGCGVPQSPGPTRSGSPRSAYHVVAVVGRARRRASWHVVGHGDPDLPPAHRRAGLLRDHADGQGDVRRSSAAVILLGHVEHRRRLDPDLGGEYNYREGVSVWFRGIFLPSSPTRA